MGKKNVVLLGLITLRFLVQYLLIHPEYELHRDEYLHLDQGHLLGAVSVFFSVILRINILYQPNSLDILLWTTFYFLLVRYIRLEHHNWLYLSALVAAIGFLNKYNIVFLFLGLLPALLLTEHRRL